MKLIELNHYKQKMGSSTSISYLLNQINHLKLGSDSDSETRFSEQCLN